jgi:23S rRNA (pseudouridine1915-N3)-methyltransferase
MRFNLVTFGKSKFAFADDGIEHYAENIRHHAEFEIELLRDQASDKEKEATILLEWLERKKFLNDGRTRIVLLDEAGLTKGSVQFSEWIQKLENEGVSRMVFVIGGAFGFGAAILAKKFPKMSLSPMTFPHDLARVVLLEQIYRALHIQAGTKYHHV